MRNVSVIGSGPAGCVFAYALMNKGYNITLYSDRTPDEWLNHSAPTGTAYLYGSTIDIERELGMDHWSQDMFEGHGVLLDFVPKVGMKPMTATGMFEQGRAGCGIDQRMRVSRWLEDFEGRGGKLVIETVSAQRLDEISLNADLTVLAAGKGDLNKAIARDPSRSHYEEPQRKLAMTFARSKSGRHVKEWFNGRANGMNAVKFDFFADEGECFWVPYYHKDEGHIYCLLWEAKEGRRMDKFDGAKSSLDILNAGKSVIRDICPWEHDIVDDMEAINDPYGWVAGQFSPTVRMPFGKMPSGGKVIPVGDTAVLFDPIGGQGGNHASKHAKWLADRVIAHGDKDFDDAWMIAVNHDWWNEYAKYAYAFNNTLLEPVTVAGKTLLMEVARNEKFASDHFFGGFPDPKSFFPYFEDFKAARKIVGDYRSTPKDRLRHKLPVWTAALKVEIAAKSLFAKNNYPSPGYTTSVMDNEKRA